MSQMENSGFLIKKFSKSFEFYYPEPGLYPSVTDNVEAWNTLIQEGHNHNENCITVKVPRRTPKVEIHLATEGSGLAFFSMDLGHIFGRNVGKDFGVILRRKGHRKPDFADDIVPYTLSWLTRTSLISKLATRKPHCCVFFQFKAQTWRHCSYCTVHELSDT